MNMEPKIFPLKFENALSYVTEQLNDGNSLAKALLQNVNFKKGHFFALLNPSADKTRIYNFRAGGILPPNPLKPVMFHGQVYPGREKVDSVKELVTFLEKVLRLGQCCIFEDVVYSKSDPIIPAIQKHLFYFHDEIYHFIKKDEFSREIAEKMIHYANAQWYYTNIITAEVPDHNKDVTEEKLQKMASRTTHIVIGAYDIEGFVVWESL